MHAGALGELRHLHGKPVDVLMDFLNVDHRGRVHAAAPPSDRELFQQYKACVAELAKMLMRFLCFSSVLSRVLFEVVEELLVKQAQPAPAVKQEPPAPNVKQEQPAPNVK